LQLPICASEGPAAKAAEEALMFIFSDDSLHDMASLTGALRAHAQDPELCKAVCRVLGRFRLCRMAQGLPGLLVAALGCHAGRADVCQAVCSLLACTAEGKYGTDICRAAWVAGAVPALEATLEAHAASAGLCREARRALQLVQSSAQPEQASSSRL
jgi:hypothetical protein